MADLQPSHGAQGLSAAACQQRDLHYVRDRRLDRGVRCACRRGPRRTRAIGWRRGRGLRGGVLWPGCVARITPVPPYRAALGPVSRVRPRQREWERPPGRLERYIVDTTYVREVICHYAGRLPDPGRPDPPPPRRGAPDRRTLGE